MEANTKGKEQWLQQVTADLKGADFREKLIHQVQGIDIQPLYTEADLPVFEENANAAFLADMDEDFAEATRDGEQQEVTWSITEEWEINANTNIDALVQQVRSRGVLNLRLRAAEDADWDMICHDIMKMKSPVNLHFDVTGPLTDQTASFWRERVGFMGDRDRLVQSIEFDPILHWEKNGYPAEKNLHFDRLANAFMRISGHLQDCRLIKVDVTDVAFKGATAVEQLVQALLRAATYMDALERRNISIFEMSHLFTFRFGVDTDFFFEIAKLRAFRILWSNLVKAFDEEMDFIANPYVHAAVTTRSFTTDDKHSNLLRSTTAAMSALLGGADAISIPPFDITSPDENAVRLATNIQLMLRYESYMDRYRDAANGSYYIESLTHQMGEQAWNQFIATYNK